MKRIVSLLIAAAALISCSKDALQDKMMQDLEGSYHHSGIVSNLEAAVYLPQGILQDARPASVSKVGRGKWDFTFTLFEVRDIHNLNQVTQHEMVMEILWNPVYGDYIARNIRSLSGGEAPVIKFVHVNDNGIHISSDYAGCRFIKD